MRAAREALGLVVVCAALYLAGTGTTPFYTRGEPREGLVAREMLASGRWLVPERPAGEVARKPPLYYWLAAACLRALPAEPERALRLPSALAGTAGVLATWAAARRAFGAAAGLPAALALATSFEWARAATSARVDMTLGAALALAFAAWAAAVAGGRRGLFVAAAAGVALGTLAKGPVALVLPALAFAGLAAARRDARLPIRLHVPCVLAAAAVVAGAWYAAAFAAEGGAFLRVVARENLLRFVDTADAGTGHAHGAAYLVGLGLVGLLPWTPLLPLAAVPLARRPRPLAAALAAAWVLAGTGFFALAAAKRSVYLLPLFPAVAMLLGAGVADPPAGGRLATTARALARAYAPAALLLAAVAGAYAAGLDPAAPLRRWLRPDDAAAAAALLAAARAHRGMLAALGAGTAGAAVPIARAVGRAHWRRVAVLVAGLALAWTVVFDGVVHPAIARDRSLASFMAEVARLVPPDAPLYASFPPDPELRFYAPRPLWHWPADGGATARRVLLWEDEWRRLADPPAPLAASAVRRPARGRLLLLDVPPDQKG
ncbi:MAG TPA: glycosyltransferase family 39 protein [Candidatus Binatia bacterium]|nr:glycosyltransferase family 39 protein [Candidatus Binatia bacterium]